jgi:two-component system, NarL family, response regulator DegU
LNTPPTSVLLVDDHVMFRQSLRRALEGEGFHIVAEASNGNEAIALALQHQPDVVLMDVSMPVLGGIDATRQITRADNRQRVVMLTMHIDKDVVDDAIKAGAVGYVTKDSGVMDVITALRLAANGDRAMSPKLAQVMLQAASLADDDESIISERESEVLQLIADGLGTTEIAQKMFISPKTVKNHLASIYEKLDARDRTQAVLTAVKMGIIKLQ